MVVSSSVKVDELDEDPLSFLTPGIYYVGQYWWSPDSQEIYYDEYDGDGHVGKLMRMAVAGGAPRQV